MSWKTKWLNYLREGEIVDFQQARMKKAIEELNEILHLPTDRLVPLPHFNNNYAYLKIGQRTPSAFLTSQEPEVFKRANAFCYNPKYKSGLIKSL